MPTYLDEVVKQCRINVRVDPQLKAAFYQRAKLHGPPAYVHRELLQAFVDGRLTVTPKTPDAKGQFYVS
jgi:hypothetical protein